MPNHSAQAIVNEFLRRRGSDAWPQQMYLQKLAYISHGWNLAINGEPLVDERPQAWDNGPVFRSVWDHIKGYGYRGKHCTLINPFNNKEFRANLTDDEKSVVDLVWKKYGDRTADELSLMTHEPGTPWFKTYFDEGRNNYLSNRDIKRHYREIALAGRARH